jgi:hypothetical protein
MDAQDDSATEFEFDERADGRGTVVRGFKLELKECRRLFRVREIRAGAAPPVHERLIGDTALAAECSGAAVVVFKLPEDAGLLFVGMACA